MTRRRVRGETLMGLLVGLSLGLLVLAAGTRMLAQQLRSHRLNLQDSHLNHDLRNAVDLMTRELHRSQYVANAWATRSPTDCTDPFCDGLEDFSIQGNRIDFGHDRNHNGQQDNNECLGYRLVNGTLQARTACRPETWVGLTDPLSLQVTALRWQLQCTPRNGWLHRSVHLSLSGHWPKEPTRTISLSQTIHLRNDLPAAVQALYCP